MTQVLSPTLSPVASDGSALQTKTTTSRRPVCANDVRVAQRRLLKMHYESGVGHIGGNLSSLDSMLVVFHDYLREKDQFFLSKGHSAGALYTTLWSLGRLKDHDLESFHRDDTLLAGHPPAAGIPEITFATGSLGHGVSLSAGTALAFQLKRSDARVVCLTSDGEWQEGSTWEGLIFASHHRLNNLTTMGFRDSDRPPTSPACRRCGSDCRDSMSTSMSSTDTMRARYGARFSSRANG